ncbi:MAG: hypothetical protein AB7F25_06850 [Deferribacterales bacterium]
MKIVAIKEKDLIKASNVIHSLNNHAMRFKRASADDRKLVADDFINFMHKNNRIVDGIFHGIILGYETMFRNAFDLNEKCLEFKPNIKAFIENEEIVTAILQEREHQREKWGDSHDDEHSCDDFCEIINLYNKKAYNLVGVESMDHDEYCRRMTQIAALAIAAIERVKRAHTTEDGDE